MRKWLINLKLSTKFFLLILLGVLSLFLVEAMNRRIAYHKYDQKLYEQNAQIMSFYVNYIETVFDRMEAVTDSIVGDQNLQEELVYINQNYRKLGYSFNLKAANSRIRKYFQKEPYFKFLMLKTDVYQFNYGGLVVGEEEINRYLEQGKDKGGRLCMIEDECGLVLTRELRRLSGSEYVHLGYILAWVDFEGIITDMKNAFVNNDIQDIDLAIYADDICLYTNSKDLEYYRENKDGWYSQGNDFVVVYTLPKLGYTMMLRTNYGEMQREIKQVSSVSVVISMMAVCIILLLSGYMIKVVIRDFERIVVKMDDYGKGICMTREEEVDYLERKDEIGRLYRHFYQMIDDHKKLQAAYDENKNMLEEMEFSWLQKQIQPHLLYNTLSAISWMAYSNEDLETADMVETLGKMMRMITDQRLDMVRVEQELEILEDYIKIQKLRYGSRLQVSIEISEQTRKILIPKITLQPLVENSVLHGMDTMISDCIIRIFEREHEEAVEIVIEDNGPGFDEDILERKGRIQKGTQSSGIALQNIHYRLRHVFSEKSGLRFARIPQGMQVSVWIPKEKILQIGDESNDKSYVG